MSAGPLRPHGVVKQRTCPRCGGHMVAQYVTAEERRLIAEASTETHETESERLVRVATAVVQVLSRRPGISLRKLRLAVRGVLIRCTDRNTDAAVEFLGDAIERQPGLRGAHRLTVEIEKVPQQVRARLGLQ